MKHQTAYVLTLLAVAITFSVPSRADSDGYFCTSKGYVAYELRKGVTPGVTGHVLKIVRFDNESGIHAAGEVVLPDFQVHIMSCNANQIEISGWDKVFTRCVIEATGPRNVSITECTEDPGRQFDYRKEGPSPPNLGRWARPGSGSIPLESLDPDHKYQLLLSFSSRTVAEKSWEVHKTELIRTDGNGNVSQRYLVYETQIVESGGD